MGHKIEEFVGKVGAGLYKIILTLLLFVGAIQGLFLFDGMRRILNRTIWLEGEPISRSIAGLKEPVYPFLDFTAAGESGYKDVCFRFLKEPRDEVWALVNGLPLKCLTDRDGSVALKDGDFLEIFCSEKVSLVVSAHHGDVEFPPLGHVVDGEGTIFVGFVKVRQEEIEKPR